MSDMSDSHLKLPRHYHKRVKENLVTLGPKNYPSCAKRVTFKGKLGQNMSLINTTMSLVNKKLSLLILYWTKILWFLQKTNKQNLALIEWKLKTKFPRSFINFPSGLKLKPGPWSLEYEENNCVFSTCIITFVFWHT